MKRWLLFSLMVVMFSCKKENLPPTCVITAPDNSEIFNIGDLIVISVDAEDPDGSIREVKIFVDDIGLSSLESFPYNLDLNTDEYEAGEHTIKATARDDEGLEKSDEIQIIINAALPVISTISVDSVASKTAIATGEVISDGGLPVLARGICWGTLPGPNLSNDYSIEGSGIGTFQSKIENLLCSTGYYARAYATNSSGTSYGENIQFTTGICYSLPIVSTSHVREVTDSSAVCGGNITDNGGANIRSRGICWSTSPDPTILQDHTTNGVGGGGFTSVLQGLACETTYYVRAYATNLEGISYGDEVSFTTDICPAMLPVVTTDAVTGMTEQTATSGGAVTDDGGGEVSARGVCWSTSENPTLSDDYSVEGSGTGSFTSSLTGLTCATTYYLRAYAINSAGTSFGDQVTFTTSLCTFDPPAVTTSPISGITQTTAQGGGNVTGDGGATVTTRGICWSPSENPTLSDTYTSDGSGMGSYTSALTGLSCGTTYYVRAYATNTSGTSYGEQVSFTTTACVVNLPTVTTNSVTTIAETTAQGGGNVTDDGGGTVTARGICWSTTLNPTLADNKTTDGPGTGSYVSSMTGLVCAMTYYVRAYATNVAGTVYGTQVSFTTSSCPPGLPTLITTSVSSITSTTAQGGGNVTDDGASAITAKGVCWSTSQNPNISNNKTSDGSGTGSYTSALTGLTCGVTYYVRAYATNSAGTSYGNQVNFTTTSCATLPTVSSNSITSIAETTAQGGGSVSSDGGATVTAKGICWSTSQNPTTFNSKTIDGSGVGSYTSAIAGLSCGTTYYVRAYATNSIGTSYGSQESFSTTGCSTVPTVTTTSISNITETTAEGGGDVTSDGGASVSVRGVCWSTSTNPTISDNTTTDGNGTGSYPSSFTGLIESTTYYVRAYATNSEGTSYGSELSFTTSTPATTVTDIDGNVYNTVQIGNQRWMAENLKATRYADGTTIPLVESNAAWLALTESDKAYCWFENSTSNRDIYGSLYTWVAAMNGTASSGANPSGVQGVCPTGWHLPSHDEWEELAQYISDDNGGYVMTSNDWLNVGGHLKSTSGWNSGGNGTDDYGFTGLAGGNREINALFVNKGIVGVWTCTTETSSTVSRGRFLENSSTAFSRDYLYHKVRGFSVRCVKD